MKVSLASVLLAALAWLPIQGSAATTAPSAATEITVNGSGTVALAPDVAIVNAGVFSNAPTAGDALSENNAIYDRVVKAVEAAGVARADVSLSYYNVNYMPKPNGPVQPYQRYGFTVNRTFSIRERDIAKAGDIVDAATAAGATEVNGVTFTSSGIAGAHAGAVSAAMADARAKADAVAAAAHLHIVGIERITDQFYGGQNVPMATRMSLAVPSPTMQPTEFDPSSVSVTATVSVTFLARP